MALRLISLAAKFVVTLLIATLIVFLLLRVLPGDPATVALGVEATPEALAAPDTGAVDVAPSGERKDAS